LRLKPPLESLPDLMGRFIWHSFLNVTLFNAMSPEESVQDAIAHRLDLPDNIGMVY
jgi:hypothetical protein